jgi:Cupin-like domain
MAAVGSVAPSQCETSGSLARAIAATRGDLPLPLIVDVRAELADLFRAFDDRALRNSYQGDWLSLTLGVLRAYERFPPSNRWHTGPLIEWERRTRATLRMDEAFDVLTGPDFAPLMPYAALPVMSFGGTVLAAIKEISRRLKLDPHGFSLLWIGSGSHVTPLHHDGAMVHARWHLVVRGAKQFDFMPPASPAVPRLPWWDLHRRFSTLYKQPLPDAWQADGTCAVRAVLEAGQMVTWGRRWWHRVEVSPTGVSVGISTRGHSTRQHRLRGALYAICSRAIGEVEHYLDALDEDPPMRTRAQLEALVRLVNGESTRP